MSQVCTSTSTGGVECKKEEKPREFKGVLIGVPTGLAIVALVFILGFLFFKKKVDH